LSLTCRKGCMNTFLYQNDVISAYS